MSVTRLPPSGRAAPQTVLLPDVEVPGNAVGVAAAVSACELSAEYLLNRDEVARYFGISKRMLEKAACTGGGPTMIKLGGRQVKYRVADIRAWIAGRAIRSTSEAPAGAARVLRQASRGLRR